MSGDDTPALAWISGGLCLLPGPDGTRAARAELEIRDGRIEAVHPPGTAAPDGMPEIDARDRLVFPGLVNAHIHSPDSLIRGSAPELPLELWSLHSAAGRVRRTPDEVRLAVQLTASEALRAGVTAVLDHVRFDPEMTPELLDAVAQAWLQTGLRATIAPVLADRPAAETMPFEASDFAGAPAQPGGYGRGATLPWRAQLALVADFAARWHGAGGRISVAVGPSGPQRCTDDLLSAAGDLAGSRNLLLHMHVLETRTQRAMGHRLYGRGMIGHLQALGVLSPRTHLVHAIWLEPGDLDLIAGSGAGVVHNPVSNAKLGSGVCAVPDMLARGIPLALGTDSACCNDGGDLLETAKWAALLHNLSEPDPERWVGPHRAFAMATAGGAGMLGMRDGAGEIAPGRIADLALVRLGHPAFAPLIDPVRQLVLAGGRVAAETVLIGGRVMLRDGRCVTIDEDEMRHEAQAVAARRLGANAGVYAAAAELAAPIRRMHARLAAEDNR